MSGANSEESDGLTKRDRVGPLLWVKSVLTLKRSETFCDFADSKTLLFSRRIAKEKLLY